MDLEASGAAACSICLDPVLGSGGGRSVAKLPCGHEFHLGQAPFAPPPTHVTVHKRDLRGTVALVRETRAACVRNYVRGGEEFCAGKLRILIGSSAWLRPRL
jgi:hypothetical protein